MDFNDVSDFELEKPDTEMNDSVIKHMFCLPTLLTVLAAKLLFSSYALSF